MTKPVHRKELTHNSVYDIVVQYQSEYRGLIQYSRWPTTSNTFHPSEMGNGTIVDQDAGTQTAHQCV
jgi:hypothetical protein